MNAENLRALNTQATPELQEAVLKTAQERLGLDTLSMVDLSGQTPAQIMDTLFVKVLDGEVVSTSQKYILTTIWQAELLRLGNKEFKYYVAPGNSGDMDIQAPNSEADWNGEYIPEYAEVFETDQKFYKKVKVPEIVLSDAWLAAEQMVEFVQINTLEMDRALVRDMENYLWTWVVANKVDVEVDGDMEAILKEATKTIKNYKTTSDEHFAVGTDGKEVLETVKGNIDYQPENMFEGSEFVMLTNTPDTTDYEWDTLAKVFNMREQDVDPNQIIDINFAKYSGTNAINKDDGTEKRAAVDIGANTKAIILHKPSLRLFEKFVYTETLKGRGPWLINHTHKEFGAYKIKGKVKPIFFTKKAGAKTAK